MHITTELRKNGQTIKQLKLSPDNTKFMSMRSGNMLNGREVHPKEGKSTGGVTISIRIDLQIKQILGG
jgi:hypothetical protein